MMPVRIISHQWLGTNREANAFVYEFNVMIFLNNGMKSKHITVKSGQSGNIVRQYGNPF